MTRKGSVTYEAVEEACFALLRKGEGPSFNSVYAELGNRGSSEIVQRYIDQWRRATGEAFFRKRDVPGLPDAFVAAGDKLLGELWRLGLNQVEQFLEDRRAALETEHAEIRTRLVNAEREIAESSKDMAALRAKLARQSGELDASEGTVQALRNQLAELHRQHESQDARLKSLQETADARDQRHTAEIERCNRLLGEERERAAQALREEGLRTAAEREQLLKQIEAARQEKGSELAGLRQLAAASEERETRQRARADEAEAALREAQKRQRQAETTIAAAQDRIDRLQKLLDAANQAVSKKESAMAAAEARIKSLDEHRQAEVARADQLQRQLAEAREKVASIRRAHHG